MTNKERNQLQKEVLDSIPNNKSCRLLLAPRTGKTKIIIDSIKRDKVETILWVTPSAKLAKVDIPFEFEKWKAKRYIKKLRTLTWMSLHTYSDSTPSLVVLDEDQFITENNVEALYNMAKRGSRIISMTGTPSKHFEKIEIYNKLKLKTVYQISINKGVDLGLLSNYEIIVHQVSLGTESNIKVGNQSKKFMTSELKQYEYLTNEVNKAVEYNSPNISFKIMSRLHAIKKSKSKQDKLISLLRNCGGRTLVFCASIKQAEEVCQYTYHSKTNNEDLVRFLNGGINTIGMVNAGGTGFTYKEIDDLIIVQCDSDKNGLTSQKISRVLLSQKNYKARIHVISLKDTQDEVWVSRTLSNFNKDKISYEKS